MMFIITHCNPLNDEFDDSESPSASDDDSQEDEDESSSSNDDDSQVDEASSNKKSSREKDTPLSSKDTLEEDSRSSTANHHANVPDIDPAIDNPLEGIIFATEQELSGMDPSSYLQEKLL
ncbi:hypothetical protein CEXT_358821 [Caerostris extrusa]|uniref:Uncharacterized protein n=1 Tax=Caerostris extrusa TaxID=172846 RepID=A0AAV4SMC0_CAEEX|nr:hypothetical protein CEXT_358821 [Caerostris extrusa]